MVCNCGVSGISIVDVSRFAYKSIHIHVQVDLHTSRSFHRHDLGRFPYIEVVSPTIRIADIKVDLHTKTSFAYISKFKLFLYIANITQGELRVKVSKETVVLGLWG